ncbi:hypothetical protein [Deinococcus cellulosilyticus]|nr:hypothetical protein [Deinococcus cellulosilyticus]
MLELLTEAFHHQPCSFCREMLFTIHAEHSDLSSELILEASLDRNMELRGAAEVHLGPATSLDGI